MVILRDTRRFELTIEAGHGQWITRLEEFVPGRLYPTLHLLRDMPTREAAVEALVRKWRVLFPEDPPLVWREPSVSLPRHRTQRARRTEGPQA